MELTEEDKILAQKIVNIVTIHQGEEYRVKEIIFDEILACMELQTTYKLNRKGIIEYILNELLNNG